MTRHDTPLTDIDAARYLLRYALADWFYERQMDTSPVYHWAVNRLRALLALPQTTPDEERAIEALADALDTYALVTEVQR